MSSAKKRLRAAGAFDLSAHYDRNEDGDEVRGGCRGGQALFSWDAVKTDKQRNMYLGNSVKANIWRSARPSDWYKERVLTDGDSADSRDTQDIKAQVKKEEDLHRKIVQKFGYGALSDIEKHRKMLYEDEIDENADNKSEKELLREELKNEMLKNGKKTKKLYY